MYKFCIKHINISNESSSNKPESRGSNPLSGRPIAGLLFHHQAVAIWEKFDGRLFQQVTSRKCNPCTPQICWQIGSQVHIQFPTYIQFLPKSDRDHVSCAGSCWTLPGYWCPIFMAFFQWLSFEVLFGLRSLWSIDNSHLSFSNLMTRAGQVLRVL